VLWTRACSVTFNCAAILIYCVKMYTLADASRGYARVIPRKPVTIRFAE
jgi:hypothetical protein